MTKKRRSQDRPPPPVPGYHWVQRSDGSGHWRKDNRNRPLNVAMKKNAAYTAATNLAAKRVMERLRPFIAHLLCGKVSARLAGAFKKSMVQNGAMDYTHLQTLDFQQADYPFQLLATGTPQVHLRNGRLHLSLGVGVDLVKRHSKLAKGYVVELIILFGDPAGEKSLRVDSIASLPYSFEEALTSFPDCQLSIDLPAEQPWMAMVKVSCTGKEIESSPKYTGMKVLRVGWGTG